MNNRNYYVVLKKYVNLNMTVVCLRYGKTSYIGGEYNINDCFTSRKSAQQAVSHYQSIGSSARYRIVEANSVGRVIDKNETLRSLANDNR